MNLANVIESFADSLSIEEADVTIRGEWREYHKRTTVQEGISSLMGLDCFASAAAFSGVEETLREFQLLFRAHLRSGKTPCS